MFDLGVIEDISHLRSQPSREWNSDMMAMADNKIVAVLQSLLDWVREKVEDQRLQVVGVLCSGLC